MARSGEEDVLEGGICWYICSNDGCVFFVCFLLFEFGITMASDVESMRALGWGEGGGFHAQLHPGCNGFGAMVT